LPHIESRFGWPNFFAAEERRSHFMSERGRIPGRNSVETNLKPRPSFDPIMPQDPSAVAVSPSRRPSLSDYFQRFLESMPEAYRHRHDAREVEVHGRIVGKRGSALVHVEICPGPLQPDSGRWICVVTDDRPGLLSLLSAAISAHSVDILAARAYCRSRSAAPDEAVDLFAVRRLKEPISGPLSERDVSAIRATIESLLRGQTTVSRIERHGAQTSRPPGGPPTAVYFGDSEPDLLRVEAADRPGLLLAVTLAIFKERLSIVRSHVTTIAGIARDEFQIAELDGAPLTDDRRRLVIEKVREALLHAD
jgi:[protein-PII] uridylyltransferase